MTFHNIIISIMLLLPVAIQPDNDRLAVDNDSITKELTIIAESLKGKNEENAFDLFTVFLDKGNTDKTEWTSKYRKALRLLDGVASPLRNEELLIPFLRAAISSGKLGEGDRMRADFRLECAMKNRPGTQATDFEFTDKDGKRRSLEKIRSEKPILLIFFDPDCSHCMEAINLIIKQKSDENFTVVAIDISEDHDRWLETKDSLPTQWIAGYAGASIEDDELYIMLDTPTIYILNADGTVAAKDITLDKIRNYSESL